MMSISHEAVAIAVDPYGPVVVGHNSFQAAWRTVLAIYVQKLLDQELLVGRAVPFR